MSTTYLSDVTREPENQGQASQVHKIMLYQKKASEKYGQKTKGSL